MNHIGSSLSGKAFGESKGGAEDRCNLILELQTPLLEPCENLVGGRLFPRFDAVDIAVDFVVALRESPELIIVSYHPLDKRDLLRKLFS